MRHRALSPWGSRAARSSSTSVLVAAVDAAGAATFTISAAVAFSVAALLEGLELARQLSTWSRIAVDSKEPWQTGHSIAVTAELHSVRAVRGVMPLAGAHS
jgi:hypothetical protein